jgi:predicted GNAT family acetyltransferase
VKTPFRGKKEKTERRSTMAEIVFEEDRNRVVAYDGTLEVGELTFRQKSDYWTLDHTYVNPQYRGQQIAQRMMKEVMERAKAAEMKVAPHCSFAQKECQLNEDYLKMVYDLDR